MAFTEASRDEFGVEPVISALRQAGVAISVSGYYAARSRPPSARAVADAVLAREITRVFNESGERYGARKVHRELAREGIPAARCTVERLMRQLGLRGVRRGGYKVRTTKADPSLERPPDRVRRQFRAAARLRLPGYLSPAANAAHAPVLTLSVAPSRSVESLTRIRPWAEAVSTHSPPSPFE